jgi:ribosome biogenesis GTP-binding protein YsxC/EngB
MLGGLLASLLLTPVRSRSVLLFRAPTPSLARPCPAAVRLLMSLDGAGDEATGGKRAARRRRTASAAAVAAAAPSSLAAEVSQLARLGQPRKALEVYDRAGVDRGEAVGAVLRGLLKLRRLDLALGLYRRHEAEHPVPTDARGTSALFLALCRASRLADAAAMLAELERAHPVPEGAAAPPGADCAAAAEALADRPLWHAAGATMLPGLVQAHLASGEPAGVEAALRLARRLPLSPACTPPPATLTGLIRGFGKARCLPGVYACLDSFAAGGAALDADALQVLVDSLVHSVRFVKGGVSMATLPEARAMPELAFVGRSNVGKSSLVNMVLGRKAIAYVSKRPGKTQQYNYFALNEESRGGAPFHLVDMPGLGYAKVPGAERKKWLAFIGRYAASRPQLRLLVHLVDGGVGPMKTDFAIMEMVRDAERQAAAEAGGAGATCPWEYVIVLTKADKCSPKALRRTERALRRAVDEVGCPEPRGVVRTSAKSKAGRDSMWRLMRRLVLDGADAVRAEAQVALPTLPPAQLDEEVEEEERMLS